MESSDNVLPYEIKVVGEDKKCLKSTLKNSTTDSTTFEKLNSSLLPKIYTLTLAESKRSMAESSILDGPDMNNNKMIEQVDILMENVESRLLNQPVSNDTVINGQTSLHQNANYLQLKSNIQDSERQSPTVEMLVSQVDVSTSVVTGTSTQIMQYDTSGVKYEKIPPIRFLSTETLIKIFKFLFYEDLSSCILVNKSWWYAAIHVLWSEPFEFIFEGDFRSETKQEKIFSLMRVYVSCFKDDVKNKLLESGISLPSEYLSRPAYNYASFLQNLDGGFLYSACREWRQWLCRQEGQSFAQIMSDTVKYQQFLLYREIFKMFVGTSRAIKKFYLDELEYSGFQCFDLLSMDSELQYLISLPGATNCFPELMYFSCDGCIPRELVKCLSELCHNIEHLSFHGCVNTGGLSGIFPLILSQKKLRHLTLIGNMGYCKTPELSIVSEAIKNIERLTLVGTIQLEMGIFTSCHNIKYLELYDENNDSSTCRVLNFIDTSSVKIERITLRIFYVDQYVNKLVEIIKNSNTNLKMVDIEWRVQSNECVSGTNRILRNLAVCCPNLLILKVPILLYYNQEAFDLFTKVLHKCQELIYLGITGPSIFRYQNYLLEFGSDLPHKLEFLYYDTIPKYCDEKLLCEFFSNIVKNLGKAISIEWNPFNQEYHNRIIKEYADSGNVILKKLNEESVFPYIGFEQFYYRKSLRGKFNLHPTKLDN
ncbi:hypothetical protein RclHR1_18800005 [Rhizophagus clarus]|uniref:F-box domain-containing protein n=1 Tax=Rhizophagus clarus TaxID=94130 RepID=A0A2Z6QN74_9GLOM|nr:hypothetical protein RclHR1_18800005 [Rhizophagus clarus]GET03797.1 hypothetical protein GLOIN_2v1634845 [Rhizophagus clarus]